jgi:Domain of unknown function (DUF1990)
MPKSPGAATQVKIASRWPLGVALTSWRYMWRTTPIHRTETTGDPVEHGPPAIPPGVSADEIQYASDGVGPLFHRLYRTRIKDSGVAAEDLIEMVAKDPDRISPSEFATFRKVRGEEGAMRVGDEFVVRMAAPWDGPVRVVRREADRFVYATLKGHLEAGQIEFRCSDRHGVVVFEIESWARNKDRLTNLLYSHMRMSKEIQVHMWTSVLERAAELVDGRIAAGIDLETVVCRYGDD